MLALAMPNLGSYIVKISAISLLSQEDSYHVMLFVFRRWFLAAQRRPVFHLRPGPGRVVPILCQGQEWRLVVQEMHVW